MLLQELFPTFGLAPCSESCPEGCERGQILSLLTPEGQYHRWTFDGHRDTLPELLDSIWTAAAQHLVQRSHALALTRIAIEKHAELATGSRRPNG